MAVEWSRDPRLGKFKYQEQMNILGYKGRKFCWKFFTPTILLSCPLTGEDVVIPKMLPCPGTQTVAYKLRLGSWLQVQEFSDERGPQTLWWPKLDTRGLAMLEGGSEGVREWGIERVREDGLLHLHIQPLETWSVGWSWSSMNSYPGLETWTPASKQGYFYSSLISVLPKVWYRSDPRCSHPLPPQWPAWASASVSGCSSWDYLAELDDQKLAVWHFY